MPQNAKSAMLHIIEGNPNNKTKAELSRRKNNEERLKVSANNIDPPSWLNTGDEFTIEVQQMIKKKTHSLSPCKI